ncbi:UNVERIFIED_CONTAM: hypothetical protein FKN15_040593 [Acipenser sinensis]
MRQWWDVSKIQTRLFCQQYTMNATKSTSEVMRELEEEITELHNVLETTYSDRLYEDLKLKKRSLAELLDSQVQGALVRSRFLKLSQMDAPTQYFFALEKKVVQSKAIHCLRTVNGQLLCDETGFPQEFPCI